MGVYRRTDSKADSTSRDRWQVRFTFRHPARSQLKPSTAKGYASSLRQLLPHFDGLRIDQIDAAALDCYIAASRPRTARAPRPSRTASACSTRGSERPSVGDLPVDRYDALTRIRTTHSFDTPPQSSLG